MYQTLPKNEPNQACHVSCIHKVTFLSELSPAFLSYTIFIFSVCFIFHLLRDYDIYIASTLDTYVLAHLASLN